jgi:DNA-binding GntR family transcriptional regulator
MDRRDIEKPQRARRSLDPTELVADIVRLIQRDRLRAGDRLVELTLAQTMGLSRPPVRRALKGLADAGLLSVYRGIGFRLQQDWDSPQFTGLISTTGPVETAYLRIARDRLEGRLEDVITESAIGRGYGLGPAEAARVLARMAREGWVERRPGYGWQFLPTFPTPEAYLQGYRFRLAVEPAAILEPGFRIERKTFDRVEASQRHILESVDRGLSIGEIFENGCLFHEEIVRASGNAFMIDAVERINRMRRLVEYRALNPDMVRTQTIEHLAILGFLRNQEFLEASRLMRSHLAAASDAKLRRLRDQKVENFSSITF